VDSSEFWFVDLVAESLYPLDVLVSPQIELALNRKTHGLSRADVLSTLRRLSRAGLIYFEREDGQCEPAFGSKVYYGLTARGGSAWEQIACPDWGRFLSDYKARTPDGAWERVVQGADRARVERCIAWPSEDTEFVRPLPVGGATPLGGDVLEDPRGRLPGHSSSSLEGLARLALQ
jgi:hypothetical protein